MITLEIFRTFALSFSDVTEEPHFEKISFRIKKKIFATYDSKNHRATLKLSVKEQDLFSLADKSIVYPVPNKWGLQGWTIFELSKVDQCVLKDALESAYNEVSMKKK